MHVVGKIRDGRPVDLGGAGIVLVGVFAGINRLRHSVAMYFRSSFRHNPATGKIDSCYRLIESYRNADDRVCHRTLLNVGFLNGQVNIDELNQIRRILCKRYQDIKGGIELFNIKLDNPTIIKELAEWCDNLN
jgi:hypothetical protein